MNLAPPTSAPPVPAPLRFTASRPGTVVRNVGQAIGATLQFRSTTPATTSSATDVLGPGPTAGGAPASPSAMGATLQTLPPAARTLAKVVPLVAAVFFWNKGDNVLAAVSAAAGGAALLWL